jgi:Tol biopolymer transport system component
MPLAPGQSLLHFRLVDKIGEGGMGEVWRAVDTTLDREVAIKVLPAAFAAEPERMARFEREAKVLASLNHPNIAAIYGFPESGGLRFLAMELVRGEDLSQILARGPLPIREALDAAKQVAAALETAHDSGVIHRDLKPANVKRTPEGQIKVLDFGLAKALETASPNTGRSATVTSAGSVAGMILGTASYMSPEQARGQAVDRRTDLWAFGCVLYEMLTGGKAFDGATVTDVLASVVRGEPDWEKLPAATPLSVRRLLRRCLEKDPKKRLRDAGDASLLLEEDADDAKTAPVPVVRPGRTPLIAAIAIAALVVAAALGWWTAHRGANGTASREIVFHRHTFARGMMRAARFAPDGRTIVYSAAWDGPPIKLYLARTDSNETTPVVMPPGELLSVSKTGEMAVALGLSYAGWVGDGTLARASLLGGSPREIIPHVRAADWSPDGSELAFVHRVEGFDQLEYPAGKVLHKTAGYICDVRISPDGERIAFADHPVWADNRGDVAVVDRSGHKTVLAHDFAALIGLAWAPRGDEVWFTGVRGDHTGFALHAYDLAGHSRVVHSSISPIELFDVAADGRVLLGGHRNERQVLAVLAGFTEPRNLVVSGESSLARYVSPDGRMALISNHLPKEYETYLVRADRPGATRLSAGDGMAISPDGTTAVSVSADAKTMLLSPLGMGPTHAVPNPDALSYEGIPIWLPDGKRIVITGRRGSEPSRGYVCDVASGAAKPFGAPGVHWDSFGGPPHSPDGKQVVLQDANGTLLRWPVDGGEPLSIPGLVAGDDPLAWTDDGAALFVGGSTVPIVITRLDLATGKRTLWKTISPSDAAGLRYTTVTISPNGKFWAMATAKLLTDLFVVDGLR